MEDEINRGLPHPVRQHAQHAILSRPAAAADVFAG
jgi:hypothetical protein